MSTTPTSDSTLQPPRGEGNNGFVGPYRLLGQIGEGGFGLVFEAEQTHPVRRRVALKVVKIGMDTLDFVARFEAERQVLALMDHPHIAKVFGAGASDDGRPYFVMELVKGEPIDSYCAKHKLSIKARLQLFGQVCEAVQHAHSKGIIHRDLKPNNVLVSTQDDRPWAKVIDFGVAKAMSGRVGDRTIFTEQGMLIGTPLYMSPEQAEGSADIDTRADIYALGVILYQLLTNTTPIESDTLRQAAQAEIQRLIREVDPPRPSTRLDRSAETLRQLASECQMTPHRLRNSVRGELDWIVMKALEKERSRRYATANGLVLDIRRYLDGDPVHAAPPGTGYRMRKFLRRHRVLVASASLVMVSLLGGVLAFAWQARIAGQRAQQLEDLTQMQAELLGQIDPEVAGRSLTDDLAATLREQLVADGVEDPERERRVAQFLGDWQRANPTDTARRLIDRDLLTPAVVAVDERLDDQPEVAIALRLVLAGRYRRIGLPTKSLALYVRAAEQREELYGIDDERSIELRVVQLGQLVENGMLEEADELAPVLAERSQRVLGAGHSLSLDVRNNLGAVEWMRGRHEPAAVHFQATLLGIRALLGDDHPNSMSVMSNYSTLLYEMGRIPEASALLADLVASQQRVLGAEHTSTLTSRNNLAFMLQAQGRHVEAIAELRTVLESYRRTLGNEHPDTTTSINTLAWMLQQQAQLDAAEPLYREALTLQRRALGATHRSTLTTSINLASLLLASGRPEEARTLLEPLRTAAEVIADDHRIGARLLLYLGSAMLSLGDRPGARVMLEEACAHLERTRGSEHAETRLCVHRLAELDGT